MPISLQSGILSSWYYCNWSLSKFDPISIISSAICSIQLRKGFNRARERLLKVLQRNALDLKLNKRVFDRDFSNDEEIQDAYAQLSDQEVRLYPFLFSLLLYSSVYLWSGC